ncbi:protein precursor [Hypoxylon crocopeplum]|nr:protein precursor [Hypoxylon crocopeplum]
MAYLLYSITFLVLVTGTILYLTRAHWLPLLPSSASHLYARLPGSFAGDIEAGLSSNTFDLSANVDGNDGRAGLDDAAKTQILAIMKKRRLRFDEARRVYMEQRFSDNGIAADGRPKDPKFVSFS